MDDATIAKIQTMITESHESLQKQIEALGVKVDPVCKVYSQLEGFGGVTSFIFKWIFLPISMFTGIALSIKHLFSK